MSDKLAEAIERVRTAARRLAERREGATITMPQPDALLAVCDAAERVRELEAQLENAFEVYDEARARAAALEGAHAIHLDLDTEFGDQLTVEELRELMQAKATLAGIERLLRAGFRIVVGEASFGNSGLWGVDMDGQQWHPTLTAAVQAALAELEKETK